MNKLKPYLTATFQTACPPKPPPTTAPPLRQAVGAIEDIPAGQLPEAVAYVHALTLHTGVLYGEVLDAEPAPAPFDDLDVAHLLLHAQDIRLFIRRYLPAFENLGIDKGGALWRYVHDTAPVFNRVRAAVLPHLKEQWLQRQIMKTAGV